MTTSLSQSPLPNSTAPVQLTNIVGGQGQLAADGHTLSFRDPCTTEEIGTAPLSRQTDVDAAFASARKAFASWRRATPAQRQQGLLRLASLVEEHAEQLLDAEIRQTGKPRAVTRDMEILRSADQLRFFAGAARTAASPAAGEYAAGHTSWVRREPVGVVAQVTPWNYPLMMAVWKLGAAISAGNTVVLKPADTTPWSTVLLAELARSALPDGVLNIVCGDRETGQLVTGHPEADMVAITGSTRAGREVMAAAAPDVKQVHLELGGKAPALIFDDVDVPETARAIASAGYFNTGQDCTAATRVLVHERIHDEFVSALVEASRATKAGEPDDRASFCGPLNSQAQLDRVCGFVDNLPTHAHIAAGGQPGQRGYFYEPTVITGVRNDDAVVQDEMFAPVLTVQPFSTESEALQLANGVDYALASSVWTNNHGRAIRLSTELDFGCVWLNCHQVIPAEMPHGGFKQSGIGNDLSVCSVEEYTRIKHVLSSHG